MLRRTGFKRPPMPARREREEGEFDSLVIERPAARMASGLATSVPVVVEKEDPQRSEPYRRLVAAMDCIHCGLKGPGVCQAAHADTGKGAGMKSDDRTCYPACATQPGRPGCHDIIGASGALEKETRRALEVIYAARTRAKVIAAGEWPAGLPMWE